MIRRLSYLVLVGVTSALAGCGGAHRRVTESSSAESAFSTYASSQPTVAPPASQVIPLPASLYGPTTCTVYDGYATQIIFRSRSLNVRTECLIWAANRVNVGYLWGYERAAALPASLHVCSLSNPHRDLTAIVIEETGFSPVSAAERAEGRLACERILATGWIATRRTQAQ